MRMAYDINISFIKNKPSLKIIQDTDCIYSLNVVVEKLKVEGKECNLVKKICESGDLKDFERFADLILNEVESRRAYEKTKNYVCKKKSK